VIENDLLDEIDLTGGGRDNQKFLAKHGVDIASMISPEILRSYEQSHLHVLVAGSAVEASSIVYRVTSSDWSLNAIDES
jgi:hypothetical protein